MNKNSRLIYVPYYVDFKTAKLLFSIGEKQLRSWIRAGKLPYVILSSSKIAKKRFRTNDIIVLMEQNIIVHRGENNG